MSRKFDQRGWNRQFKWQPLRIDRWDPFPKDRLPFVDDYSIRNQLFSRSLPPRRNFMPAQDTPMHDAFDRRWNNRIGNNRIIPRQLHRQFDLMR